MYLNKLLLKDFGKFHNKEISLKAGLNLVYGENEAGKTTVKEFIVGMLYGIDKARGIAARFDTYELHKPFYNSGYAGKAYVHYQGKNYLIERSFLRHNRKLSVMDIQSGRELPVKTQNTLHGTMFDLDKNTYVNTLCIGEHGAAPGKELAHKMDNYLANMTTTGSADIDKTAAIEYLKDLGRQYDARDINRKMDDISEELEQFADVDEQLAKIRDEIHEVEEEFAIETARRKREARKLIDTSAQNADADEDEDEKVSSKQTEGHEQGSDKKEQSEKIISEAMDDFDDEKERRRSELRERIFLNADLLEDFEPKKKLTDRLWFICLVGLFVIGVIALMVNILPFDSGVRQLFIVCTTLFVIVTIVEGLYSKGTFEDDVNTPTEDEFREMIYQLERKTESHEEVEIDMSFAKSFMDKKVDLQAAEKVLMEKQARREELNVQYAHYNRQLVEMERELHAIHLAINTINDMSSEIHNDLGFLINNNISDIVSKITDGKYTDVYLDENLHVMVRDNENFVGIEYLSAGTIEQIYLAVRLSVARLLCRDRMPLIIDDIFTNYDERRLKNTLDCLKTIDTEQIVLLTSNPHIGDMLDDLDMDYNYVELSNA
ncbi:MAG: AAA family ATPase [Eubacteriales bacterium]|nr:AAA family ATPase [Lachnospiraceae bacterium]MDO5126880.1 AAA family ATPase [Eubacteriales bacterium]